MAKTVARVHTQGNLVDNKKISIVNALLNIYARDG